MSNIAIVYESLYGATERYAGWIAEALGAPLFLRKKVKPRELAGYDTIVFGGGLIGGNLVGAEFLTKNSAALADKRLVVFTCGLTDPGAPEGLELIRAGLQKQLSPELYARCTFFHFRGALEYARLRAKHKAMLALARQMVLSKPPEQRREHESLILRSFGERVDLVDRAAILPLLEYFGCSGDCNCGGECGSGNCDCNCGSDCAGE